MQRLVNGPVPGTGPLTVALLDFDGVLRHFDPTHVIEVERRHALTPGVLQATAFESTMIDPVVTGRVTRAEWTEQIGETVGNPTAAREWLAARGAIDQAMLDTVDRLRATGTRVAVLTNGTDTVDAELADFGVTERFDAVFSSAAIGFAKPDPRAFRHVCAALDVSPEQVFFTDDTVSKLAGAIELGMTARHFIDHDRFLIDLAEAGLLPVKH